MVPFFDAAETLFLGGVAGEVYFYFSKIRSGGFSMKKLMALAIVALFATAAANACDGKDGEKSKTKDKTKTEASK